MTETEKPSQQQTLSIASFALPLASTDRYLLLKWSYLIQQLIGLRVEVNKYTVPNTRRTRTGKSRMLAYPRVVLQKHSVPNMIPNRRYTSDHPKYKIHCPKYKEEKKGNKCRADRSAASATQTHCSKYQIQGPK